MQHSDYIFSDRHASKNLTITYKRRKKKKNVVTPLADRISKPTYTTTMFANKTKNNYSHNDAIGDKINSTSISDIFAFPDDTHNNNTRIPTTKLRSNPSPIMEKGKGRLVSQLRCTNGDHANMNAKTHDFGCMISNDEDNNRMDISEIHNDDVSSRTKAQVVSMDYEDQMEPMLANFMETKFGQDENEKDTPLSLHMLDQPNVPKNPIPAPTTYTSNRSRKMSIPAIPDDLDVREFIKYILSSNPHS